jgi:chromosomal replication initiation ATPase DnaA
MMRLQVVDTPPSDQRAHYKSVRNRLFGGQRRVPKLSPSIPVPRISWTFGTTTATGNIISFGFQTVTIARITDAVCEFYNINDNDLKSACRAAKIVYPRQVAMYLCRELTPKSFPLIGRVFGGRDHTTALHAWRKISALVEDDERMADEIAILIRRVRD